jgi:hypothetical protein
MADASDDPGGQLSPAEAFGRLANETRVRILRTLGECGERDPRRMPYTPFDTDEPEGLPYSELRERADVRDSGRFNYHLGQLVDHFVRKSGDTYRLSWLGILAFRFVTAGVLHDQVTVDPFETDSPCGNCGTPLEAYYPSEQLFFLECPDCGSRPVGTDLPAHAIRNRSGDELLRVLDRRERGQISLMRDGICYWCAGRVEAAVHPPPTPADEGVRRNQPTVTYLCQDCGGLRFPSVGEVVATDPRVVAFLVTHAAGFEERFLWEWPFVTDPDAVTVTATEPMEVRVSVTGDDGQRLAVTVDERARVVSVDRD